MGMVRHGGVRVAVHAIRATLSAQVVCDKMCVDGSRILDGAWNGSVLKKAVFDGCMKV